MIFLDMAGLRETEDSVEREGVTRAVARAQAAELRLRFESEDAQFPACFEGLIMEQDVRVATKVDLGAEVGVVDASISSVTGVGVAALLEMVETKFSRQVAEAGVLAHMRQQEAVQAACSLLESARLRLEAGCSEVIAEDLRAAAQTLSGVVGGIGTEDILGEVFSRFCVGK